MKVSYAPRRAAFYPYDGGTGWEFPPPEVRGAYLAKVRALGFAGIEIGLGQGVGTSEVEIRALREDLQAAGVPCAAVRGGAVSRTPQRGRAPGGASTTRAGWRGGPERTPAKSPP